MIEHHGAAHDRYLEPPDDPGCDRCPCEDNLVVGLDCWNAGVCTCHPATARLVSGVSG